jgi:hypothetical protein
MLNGRRMPFSGVLVTHGFGVGAGVHEVQRYEEVRVQESSGNVVGLGRTGCITSEFFIDAREGLSTVPGGPLRSVGGGHAHGAVRHLGACKSHFCAYETSGGRSRNEGEAVQQLHCSGALHTGVQEQSALSFLGSLGAFSVSAGECSLVSLAWLSVATIMSAGAG